MDTENAQDTVSDSSSASNDQALSWFATADSPNGKLIIPCVAAVIFLGMLSLYFDFNGHCIDFSLYAALAFTYYLYRGVDDLYNRSKKIKNRPSNPGTMLDAAHWTLLAALIVEGIFAVTELLALAYLVGEMNSLTLILIIAGCVLGVLGFSGMKDAALRSTPSK